MRGGRTLAAVAAALTIAMIAGSQPEPPGPGASAAPGMVPENPGAHPSGRTRSQRGGVDPGNTTHIQSGNTRFYSPRGVARPGETVTRGAADPEVGTPQGGNRQTPGGG